MKKIIRNLVIIVLVGTFGFSIVRAQNEEIILNLSRDYGYSSGFGKIQGLFSMSVSASIPFTEVVFYIDSKPIGKDVIEPYKIKFNTDDYPPGVHTLYAIGYTSDERELKTKELTVNFVTAEESNQTMLSIVIPVLGLALIIVVLTAIIPAISARKKGLLPPGTQRNYGLAGGTICSKCKKPFARHALAPNMLFGKLERCPYCGKWGIARAYPLDALREAEKVELDEIKNSSFITNSAGDEEEMRKELDNTKYQGL